MRVLLLGEPSSGKTSLLHRLHELSLHQHTSTTTTPYFPTSFTSSLLSTTFLEPPGQPTVGCTLYPLQLSLQRAGQRAASAMPRLSSDAPVCASFKLVFFDFGGHRACSNVRQELYRDGNWSTVSQVTQRACLQRLREVTDDDARRHDHGDGHDRTAAEREYLELQAQTVAVLVVGGLAGKDVNSGQDAAVKRWKAWLKEAQDAGMDASVRVLLLHNVARHAPELASVARAFAEQYGLEYFEMNVPGADVDTLAAFARCLVVPGPRKEPVEPEPEPQHTPRPPKEAWGAEKEQPAHVPREPRTKRRPASGRRRRSSKASGDVPSYMRPRKKPAPEEAPRKKPQPPKDPPPPRRASSFRRPRSGRKDPLFKMSISDLKATILSFDSDFEGLLTKADLVQRLRKLLNESKAKEQRGRFHGSASMPNMSAEELARERVVDEVRRATDGKFIWELLNDIRADTADASWGVLERSSSLQQVQRVYKRALLKIHPDKVDGADTLALLRATELFKAVNSAYAMYKEVNE